MDGLFNLSSWQSLLLVVVVLLLWAYYQRLQHLRRRYHRRNERMMAQSVVMTSRLLLSTFSEIVERAKEEDIYQRDPNSPIAADRASAMACSSIFSGLYNLVVVPVTTLDPVFNDLLITGTEREDVEEGVFVSFYLGEQRNDVVRHFIPDRSLQAFITQTRAFSAYLRQAANTKPPQ
jgi:hypothetical protein